MLGNSLAMPIAPPSLPTGGGAIQGMGEIWGATGVSGTASLSIPVPVTAARFSPALQLAYNSSDGRTVFGQGWSLHIPAIARRTSKGVPTYRDDDEFIAPDGESLVAERDETGAIVSRTASTFRGANLGASYTVVRYFRRARQNGNRIESWRKTDGSEWFWLVQEATGTLHIYGKSSVAQTASGSGTNRRIALWWREESVSPHGEKIRYDYLLENDTGLPDDWKSRDHATHVYLWRVNYGNTVGSQIPSCMVGAVDTFLFELILDYGQRTIVIDEVPPYQATNEWLLREDPYSSFAFGFEDRSLRLCHQILMFHSVSGTPALVARLLLEYVASPFITQLTAAHQIGYSKLQTPKYSPPLEFTHTQFPPLAEAKFTQFSAMPGLNDGSQYQLVDLYGDGLAGVLHQAGGAWYYREPVRANIGGDAVSFGEWSLLPHIPVSNSQSGIRQLLGDMTGDGRLDWLVSRPGMHGFFTLNPDRTWSGFVPFAAFPSEFSNNEGFFFADLVGRGLTDFALIGTNSVRLYANAREVGFEKPIEIAHDEDLLPGPGDGRGSLIAFCDIFGSGEQHLIRIRHNELVVWPNLGRGRFGQRMQFAVLPFAAEEFDANRVRMADLDGTGAADLLYMKSDHALVFRNRSGNTLDAPEVLNWPEGMLVDDLCEFSVADLQGLGCSSLVVTKPNLAPVHWRCDFVPGAKPFLLNGSDNNMGTFNAISYRSSAQEWLDEKEELRAAQKPVASHLPFAVQVVVRQERTDQITAQKQTQIISYRHGFYDGSAREFRGFGLLMQYDSELSVSPSPVIMAGDGSNATALVKTWFHVGREEIPSDEFNKTDGQIIPLGPTLYAEYQAVSMSDVVRDDWDEHMQQEMLRALAGSVVRSEVYGLDDNALKPFNVIENRYLVRVLEPSSEVQQYAIVQPELIESRNTTYERMPSDPSSVHQINLQWDAQGSLTHSATVYYARRSGSPPPEITDEHALVWWNDSHDDRQSSFYINESLGEIIHLTNVEWWRLGLNYRSRVNAIASRTLVPADVNYESFISPDGPLGADALRVLTSLVQQYYLQSDPGEATFEALPYFTEIAELDDAALQVYGAVMTPEELQAQLLAAGYVQVASFLPDDGLLLWAVQRGFTEYSDQRGFFNPIAYRPTQTLGKTTVEYDGNWIFPIRIETPDQLITQLRHDSHIMQPVWIQNANLLVNEATFDAGGSVMATTFYGNENGSPVGFAPISDYVRVVDFPEDALADPVAALGTAAIAYFYDPFAWMGQVTDPMPGDLADCIAKRWLMPGGFVRASARRMLGQTGYTDSLLSRAISSAAPRPPNSLVLQADRYPGDPALQIRMSMTYSDGFGRALQQMTLVEPGDAYVVDSDGMLKLENGVPVLEYTETRWRVTGRIEYNCKGLAIRTYRPYFTNAHYFVRDDVLQAIGLCDRQYYDPLNRPTVLLTAGGQMRRQTRWAWCSLDEDENDTAAELYPPPADLN